MLEELKEYKIIGRKEDIDYVIYDVFGEKALTQRDASMLTLNRSKYSNDFNAILRLLVYFNVIVLENDKYYLPDNIAKMTSDRLDFDCWFVCKLIEALCDENFITNQMFEFEPDKHLYLFKKEHFSLQYSQLRDLLVSYGFFLLEREKYNTKFYVAKQYEKKIEQLLKKKAHTMTIEDLQKKVQEDAEIGELAEQFVLEYERERLNYHDPYLIRQVSLFDVSAGYDIASYNSDKSILYDRFIEVKAVNSKMEFFWSKSEIEEAKRKRDSYYLYLVESAKLVKKDYIPQIIRNPYENLFLSDEWLMEPQSYKALHTINNKVEYEDV